MDVFPRVTGDGGTDEPTIGARLRALRREHGLSRESLAERAELSVDLIAKLEQDRRTTCRIDSLRKLTNALDVEVTELIDTRERPSTERDDGTTRVVVPPPSWAVRLRIERRMRGWSEHEMARRLLRAAGFSQGSLRDMTRQILGWETGEQVPREVGRRLHHRIRPGGGRAVRVGVYTVDLR